jgi:hypothetical protein
MRTESVAGTAFSSTTGLGDTATTLAWAVHLISRHPDVERRARTSGFGPARAGQGLQTGARRRQRGHRRGGPNVRSCGPYWKPLGSLPRSPLSEASVRRPCFCGQRDHGESNYSSHQRVTDIMFSVFNQ